MNEFVKHVIREETKEEKEERLRKFKLGVQARRSGERVNLDRDPHWVNGWFAGG